MDSISLARSTGQRLLAVGHPSTPNIRQALADFNQELNILEGAWHEHQLHLHQALDLQVGSLHPTPTAGTCAKPTALVKAKAREAAVPGAFPTTHHPSHPLQTLPAVTPSVEPGPSPGFSLGHQQSHATRHDWTLYSRSPAFSFLDSGF